MPNKHPLEIRVHCNTTMQKWCLETIKAMPGKLPGIIEEAVITHYNLKPPPEIAEHNKSILYQKIRPAQKELEEKYNVHMEKCYGKWYITGFEDKPWKTSVIGNTLLEAGKWLEIHFIAKEQNIK